MNMPDAIREFFEADQRYDGQAPVHAFTRDAVVLDEGRSHAGHEEIAGWWGKSKEKYRHTAEPLNLVELGDRTEVRARVTGEFPGSPAVLTFRFRLQGERIGRLEIGP